VPHYPAHLLAGVVLLGLTLAAGLLTANRLIRSRLRVSFALLVAFLALDAFLILASPEPELASQLRSVETLTLALAIINALVMLLINPIRVDRVPERFPAIVQDAVVVTIFAIFSTFVLREKFLTTTAVGAVVVGFALQDTLGNMFAGLAIQVDKPFRVGHWITAGDWEGVVVEVTWRATKLRTRNGNEVVVPNSEIGKLAVNNYSEPVAPTRLFVEVGTSYTTPPGVVKASILRALAKEPSILQSPPPQVLLHAFGDSALINRVYFWIDDFSHDEVAYDRVRCAIYYGFQRDGIEIPYPIQVEYGREEVPEPASVGIERRARMLERAALFATFTDAQREQLAALCREVLHGPGQPIVSEGEPGSSAFVIAFGSAQVTIAGVREPVAVLGPGDYFGEMSLLTGEPRMATVTPVSECRLIEIAAEGFREFVMSNAAVLDVMSAEVTRRRDQSARARSTIVRADAPAESATSLLTRIRQFLLGAGDDSAA
jgi:small-conductance mechanosensitive channel/CRP-like cAMP-binding protein